MTSDRLLTKLNHMEEEEESSCPSDLIFEILTRTSLRCLNQCKSVCKDWKNMTYDSTFTSLHCQRSGTKSGYFVQNLISNKHKLKFVTLDQINSSCQNINSLDFLPHPVKVVASSKQGILCCVSVEYHRNSTTRYYVCKPTTRQWTSLPNPKIRYFTIKVGMVVVRSNPLRYKIIRLSSLNHWLPNSCNLRWEVFDSDTWKWRELESILLPPDMFLCNIPSIVVCGAIYWLLSNNRVLAFDIHKETSITFALPYPIISEEYEFHYSDKRLLNYNDRLGFMCREPSGCLVLWVMEDYKNCVWEKREEMSIEGELNFHHLIMMVPQEVFVFCSDCEPINLRGRG